MTVTTIQLDEASIEAVAARVADLLRGEDMSAELVDAGEVARRFNVSRDFVYGHADDLGAVRLGDGPRARLRFDPATVAERLSAPAHSPARPRRERQRRRRTEDTLLPIRQKHSKGLEL